nr:MAG TPA: hypothetical protein [Caudoviricetes sp.]
MAKKPTEPLKITLKLSDGRINSTDGVIMFDSILYHAWFFKYKPEVLDGLGANEYDGYIGLPLLQLPGNRWSASRGIYEEEGKTIEYINKRPNFFDSGKSEKLDQEKGTIDVAAGKYRAYRVPFVIRTIKNGEVTFFARGTKEKIDDLLEKMKAVGKKTAIGYGMVSDWEIDSCENDFTLWHPEYGLMRPVEVESEEAKQIPDAQNYPVMMYGVKPPYWKPKNARLCYVPIR